MSVQMKSEDSFLAPLFFRLNVNVVEAEQVHTGTVHSVLSEQRIELRGILSDDLIPPASLQTDVTDESKLQNQFDRSPYDQHYILKIKAEPHTPLPSYILNMKKRYFNPW